MKNIRFGAVYGALPVFCEEVASMGYLDVASLGLSVALQSKVIEWDQAFQETFWADYPPDSRFPSEEALISHNLRGAALAELIKGELRLQVSVEFLPLRP